MSKSAEEIGSCWDAPDWPDAPGSVVDVMVVHAQHGTATGPVVTIVRAADWPAAGMPGRIGRHAKARMDAKKRAWILGDWRNT